MRNSTAPSLQLRFLLWIVIFVTAGTHIDSFCFHGTPSFLLTIYIHRKQPPRRRTTQGQQAVRDAVGSASADGDPKYLDYHPNEKRDPTNGFHDHDRITNRESSLDRRSFLWASPSVLLGLSSSMMVGGGSLQPLQIQIGTGTTVAKAASAPQENRNEDSDSDTKANGGRLTDQIVQSLVFERVLGSGSYKTVYLVSATIPAPHDDTDREPIGSMRTVRYALAVEQLRNKRDVKNAFRGVLIPDLIQQGLNNTNNSDRDLFETIVDWWVQSSNVPEYAQGRRVVPAARTTTTTAKNAPVVVDIDKTLGRTRSEPKKNFLGSRWMLSFKPVYETDLKRFIRNAPVLFPVGKVGMDEPHQGKNPHGDKLPASLSYYWTEPVLMAFVLEILHAGKLMHEANIVHRDIKPKNMMISVVPSTFGSSTIKRPVIIDYGFAEVGSPLRTNALEKKKKDICVVRPGQLKGEVDYVLAEDLANYRGCQRGDAYAMGKTLYEFVFGSSESQLRDQEENQKPISVEGAEIQNREFRNLLFDDAEAGTESRFHVSRCAADCLLSIMRGLCSSTTRQDGTNVLSFAEAEDILSDFLSPSPSR